MKEELLKIKTEDNIELAGILYSPYIKTNKVVVHVHGLAGNFYENSFVDYQAKSYTDNGYAYFSFNNRGNGYFTELIKKENDSITYPMGGCAFELFEDCLLDIKAAIMYMKELGYSEIILQGHSFGCSKVAYYYSMANDSQIKKLILLAPCDMIKIKKDDLGNIYNEYFNKAKQLISNEQGESLINCPGFPPFDLSADTFCSIYTENCNNDIFRYRDPDYISEVLTNIEIPVLIQIGTKDEYVLTQKKDVIEEFFNINIKNGFIKFIDNSNHGYHMNEQTMCDNCIKFLSEV